MDSEDAGSEMTGHLGRPPGNSILTAQPAVWVTSDSPNLSDCHRCGARRADLQFLTSNWRLTVLCDGCLKAINSAEACSYCFSNFAAPDHVASLNCQLCHRQIHPECILSHHRFRRIPYSNSFTCIDCCPYSTPRPSLLTEKSNTMEQSDRRLQLAPNISQIGVTEFDEQLGCRLQPVPNGLQTLETRSGVAESDEQSGHLLQPAPNCSQSLETNNGVAGSDDQQFSRHLQLPPDTTPRVLSCSGQRKLKFKNDISEDRAFFRRIKSIMSQEGSHYRMFYSSCKDDVGCVSDSRPKEPCASSFLGAAVIREESQSRKFESSCKDVVGCESDSSPEEISASTSGAKQNLHSKKYSRKPWQMKGILDTEGCLQTGCLEEQVSIFNGKDSYSQKYNRKPRKLRGMVNPVEFSTAQCTQTNSTEHETFYDASALCYVYKLSRSE